jgi:hypothetical protein
MGAFIRSAQESPREIDARGKLPAAILIACCLIPCVSLTSCLKKSPPPVQKNRTLAPALPGAVPSPTADRQSCQAFVQDFYDWYWNRYAERAKSLGFDLHTLPNVETVLARKPSVLSPELSQLIADDRKKMLATHQSGKLDFDPFWGNQDAQGKYVVGRVSVTGDRCKARVEQGDETVELQRSGSSWVFVNIYYCFAAYDPTAERKCPDNDLVQILKP